MDVLVLCWAFDSRWVFNIHLKLHFIWVAVLIDLITLIAFSVEHDPSTCCSTTSTQTILACIIFGHISVMTIAYLKAIKERNRKYENKSQIHNFMFRQYHIVYFSHTKKTIWSVVGLFIVTMSFILFLLQCCQVIIKQQCAIFVKTRAIVDIACWIYLSIIVILFILCKVFYLIWAWKFPISYLRYRGIIK